MALVVVNLYVFVWGRKSLRNVYRTAQTSKAKGSSKGSSEGSSRGSSEGSSRGSSTTKKPNAVVLRKRGPNRFLRMPRVITARTMVEQEEDSLLEIEAFTVHGRIRRGDNLYSALKRVGVNRLLGDVVVRTLDHLYNFRRARPGHRLKIRLSQDRRRLLAFEYQASPGEIYRIVRRGRKLLGKKVNRPVVTRVFELAAPVKGSLWATFKNMGEDGRLLAAFTAIFSWDLNLYTDVHPGDVIRLIVEKQFQGEEHIRYGRVLAAELVGKRMGKRMGKRSGKRRRVRAFWYRPPKGSSGYFDEQGSSLHRILLKAPLRYKRISSNFDPRRMHPVLHVVRAHNGVDYAAPQGTPIWAVADGEVVYIGRNRAAGKMIVLHHENNMRTVYMHMHGYRRGLKKGHKVRQRQVIGYVGATGVATGPHLHFGLKIGGVYVDPLKHNRTRRPPVPKKHRADFIRCITPLSGTLNSLRPGDRPIRRPAGRTVLKTVEKYRAR
jgi:murein DD-endopeptidase MepM/ murein hydrolase activator NlpD